VFVAQTINLRPTFVAPLTGLQTVSRYQYLSKRRSTAVVPNLRSWPASGSQGGLV